jgi:hypothetical protein
VVVPAVRIIERRSPIPTHDLKLMPRFTVLEHVGAPDDPAGRHFDLLLEAGTACRTWRLMVVPTVDGATVAALTGVLLLGWSGGGFIGVGQPYLFMTLAAVVMGGTSLLGGQGGYGFTVIGVLVLQVLTSFLVGMGLKFEWQQFIFGLLILPMVALYARSPHIRTQI